VADNREVIAGLEREWRDALCGKDIEHLRSLMHPDFVLIGTRTAGPFLMHRDDWLDAIQRREVETIEFDVKDATAFDNVISAPSTHAGGSNISAARSRIACS